MSHWEPKTMKPVKMANDEIPEPELFTKVVNGEVKYFRKRYIPKNNTDGTPNQDYRVPSKRIQRPRPKPTPKKPSLADQGIYPVETKPAEEKPQEIPYLPPQEENNQATAPKKPDDQRQDFAPKIKPAEPAIQPEPVEEKPPVVEAPVEKKPVYVAPKPKPAPPVEQPAVVAPVVPKEEPKEVVPAYVAPKVKTVQPPVVEEPVEETPAPVVKKPEPV